MGQRPGVLLYFDRVLFLDRLTDAQNGQIFRAAIHYARDGIVPAFDDQSLLMAWDFLRPALDEDAVKYEKRCEKNRENAAKRWHANASERMPNTETAPNSKATQTQSQPQTQRNDLERALDLLRQAKGGGGDG